METVKTFSTEEINWQLQHVLDSPPFRNSPTLTKFLTFVVSQTILGKEQHLKEYSIAVNVLNRPADFNPHDDAVVRIHAGRLRRALNDYYLIQGMNDPIIIQIPKGGYIPQFEAGDTNKAGISLSTTPPETGANPIVAVFPFRIMPQSPAIEQFSLNLREQLSAELSRFEDISVIGYYSTEIKSKIEQNILEAGKSVHADYIITGSIQHHEQSVRIMINLLNTKTGEVLMGQSFERENVLPGVFELQDEIVKSVIGAVGGYYGIIFQQMAKTYPIKESGNSGIQQTIYNYYRYQRSYSPANYQAALSTLLHSVKAYPDHALCWAMLGELYLNGLGLGIGKVDDALGTAYQSVLQSLKIDPHCQHAWHTLTGVHLFRNEKEACRDAALQCIRLNPNNSFIVSGAGCMLICAGYFEEGFPIMDKAIKLNPYYPWWINAGFSFYYLHQKEYAAALFWAEKMNADKTFWGLLLKIVSLSYLDDKDAAQEYLSKLLNIEPGTSIQIRDMLSTFILSEELVTHIIEGLEKIGFQQTV